MRVAFPAAFVERMILQWDWKYDANPFNREAENARRADRARLSATVRSAADAADLEKLNLDDDSDSRSEPYCLLLRNAGVLIGMIGALPQQFVIGGSEHWVSDGCDFVVHPTYRGQQLSIRLGKVLAADNAIIQGWSNSAGRRSARSLLRGLGDASTGPQKNSDGIHSARMRLMPLFKPIDFRSLAEYLSEKHLIRKTVEVFTGSVDLLRKTFIKMPSVPGIRIQETQSFDDGIDRLWSRARGDYAVIGVRNSGYLNWRFVARPDASYRYLIALRENDIVAWCFASPIVTGCGAVMSLTIWSRSSRRFVLAPHQGS
jgi:hypothetical protein